MLRRQRYYITARHLPPPEGHIKYTLPVGEDFLSVSSPESDSVLFAILHHFPSTHQMLHIYITPKA
jgi:hypothetical protein